MVKKPGRPKGYKAPDPKNNRVMINLTAEDFALFNEGCKVENMTRQQFGRDALKAHSLEVILLAQRRGNEQKKKGNTRAS